ncbi:hypothetical protein B0H66DRAFT_257098 [Apodospora peruviana]|uniref:Uncharacterized protein n=1 Tax=Apodospora peruviana TaxID=516989 RepID=A0AAE0I5R1_9PEZI|nr:hypothetical protein B0H66DRAFT_257098 [Apodospora peruviana]
MAVNFLRLPGEIRNVIYESLLVPRDPNIVVMMRIRPLGQALMGYFTLNRTRLPRWFPPPRERFPEFTPNLLLVDRRVHSEASSVLYGMNNFRFYRHDFHYGNEDAISALLESLGPRNSSLIRSVTLYLPLEPYGGISSLPIFAAPYPGPLISAFQERFTSLQRIEVRATQSELNRFALSIAADPFGLQGMMARARDQLRSIPSVTRIGFHTDRPPDTDEAEKMQVLLESWGSTLWHTLESDLK